MTCCVATKGMRGTLSCMTQDKLKSKKAQIEARVTSTAAVMEGDPKFPNLIVSSVYDTKPVHYISIVSEQLKWDVKEKECLNIETGQFEILRFLRMN